jgi:CubicO group peptidase (beta-lactamase class C family)
MLASAFSLPLLFAPATQWAYSNLGYFALAEIIERISGAPFDAFLSERIFRRAGMSTIRTTSLEDLIKNRSSSYLSEGGRLYNAGDHRGVRPSGAFVSTVMDLAAWAIALNDGEVLRRESCEEMERPVRLADGTTRSYGFGWVLEEVNGQRLVRHGGGLWCLRTEFVRLIEDGLAVIVLCNCREANAAEIAMKIAAFYIPDVEDTRVATTVQDVWLEPFSE